MTILLDQPQTQQQERIWEEARAKGIDLHRLPRHIAIIMDGNGRWAKALGKPRIEGHRTGANSVSEIVRTCCYLGIDYLTLYAFSSENWKRPKTEIAALMLLLETFLRGKTAEMIENSVRLNVIGLTSSLPAAAQRALSNAIAATADGERLVLTLALSYGSRNEIVEATKRIANKVKNGELNPEDINPEVFSKHLMTGTMPDPDLLIRTSGEMRISNFLLWQIAYSEIWVTNTHWPDFRRANLLEALADYQRRERRFGHISGAEPTTDSDTNDI